MRGRPKKDSFAVSSGGTRNSEYFAILCTAGMKAVKGVFCRNSIKKVVKKALQKSIAMAQMRREERSNCMDYCCGRATYREKEEC